MGSPSELQAKNNKTLEPYKQIGRILFISHSHMSLYHRISPYKICLDTNLFDQKSHLEECEEHLDIFVVFNFCFYFSPMKCDKQQSTFHLFFFSNLFIPNQPKYHISKKEP